MEVWKQAFVLEEERAELLDLQLRSEYVRLGKASETLLEEFEGCIVALDDLPSQPESEVPNEWAAAYTSIRRCNEQSELKLAEMRNRMEEKADQDRESVREEVRQDFGPILYKGITFKDITFKRLAATGGSSIFFVELQMPLGTSLEEKMVDFQRTVARTVEVTEVAEGGSAFKDGTIKAGDLLRAITVPQRRLSVDPEMGEGEGSGGLSDALGVGAGEQTKALLVIPTESSFPFERILEEIKANSKIDGMVGMVFERPFKQ